MTAGRPAFEPTEDQRVEVERYLSCGMTEREIAHVLGISEPTLRKHFKDNLDFGLSRRRAQIVNKMYEMAEANNATIVKRLDEVTGGEVRATVADQFGAVQEDGTPRRARLGKKEVENLEAHTAGDGTEWGDDLAIAPPGDININ